MKERTDYKAQNSKIYTESEIGFGTLIGGPLAAGYFIAENFKVFNKSGRARKTWIISVAVIISILCYFFIIPELFVNPIIILIIIAAIVWFLTVRHQGENIRNHISLGREAQSWIKTFIVSFTGLIASFILISGLSLLLDNFVKTSISYKTYGTSNNEIAFDKTKISDIEVDEIGDAFINADYFNESDTKYVFVEKTKKGYALSLAVPENLPIDTSAIRLFDKLKTDLQNNFPDKKIILNLVVGSRKNIIKQFQ